MERLFSGGLVFDGHSAPVAGLGVLLRGERIARVASASEFESYAGARVDTTGMTLLPGLIDAHVHLCGSGDANLMAAMLVAQPTEMALRALEMAQHDLRAGITTLRDLGGVQFAELQVRDAVDAGRQLGPSILCAGQGLTITGGHARWAGFEIDSAAEAVRAVRENVKRGVDLIKIISTGGVATPGTDPLRASLSKAEVEAGVGEAKRLGKRSAAHAGGAAGIALALDAGIDSIEHGFELTEPLIGRMLAQGTFLVPTLSALDSALRNVRAGVPRLLERLHRFACMQRESFGAFVRAGGLVAMGTDAGTPFNFHGNNPGELQLMVQFGMSPLAALRAATVNAAQLLGLEDRGAIREGLLADLLLVDGDPSVDIERVAVRTHHQAVYKGGIDVHAELGRGQAGPPMPRFVAGECAF